MTDSNNPIEATPEFKTLAQKIFGGKEILTKRPDDMSIEVYKAMVKMQSYSIKRVLNKNK